MRGILRHKEVSFILGMKAGAVTENQHISTVSIGLRRGKSCAISIDTEKTLEKYKTHS